MAGTGMCCGSLEETKALMKMGLSMVLVGHVNFLLGALVHGVVLRHINLHKQARAMEYAISNVFAMTSGLVGIVVGILAIVLSKNKKSRGLTWSLFSFGLAAALAGAASAVGLAVSVVRAIVHGGRSLLTHCRFPDAIGYSSVTNECPFDPTRIYSTTLILWIPLIVVCVIQTVFSARCSAVCVSFLGLSCCPVRRKSQNFSKSINVVRPITEVVRESRAPTRSSSSDAVTVYIDPATRYAQPPRRHKLQPQPEPRAPPAPAPAPAPTPQPQQRPLPPPLPPPKRLPPQHRSLPPAERRSRPPRERSDRARQQRRDGSQRRLPEQQQLLDRGTLERSSFWI